MHFINSRGPHASGICNTDISNTITQFEIETYSCNTSVNQQRPSCTTLLLNISIDLYLLFTFSYFWNPLNFNLILNCVSCRRGCRHIWPNCPLNKFNTFTWKTKIGYLSHFVIFHFGNDYHQLVKADKQAKHSKTTTFEVIPTRNRFLRIVSCVNVFYKTFYITHMYVRIFK